MTMYCNPTQNRGFTLFYSVLVSSIMLAIGLAIFNITLKELKLSAGSRDSQKAFYAADTGIECALFWDLKGAGQTGVSAPPFGFYGDSLSSGIIGFWRLDDGSGDIALDISSSENHGSLTNSPTWVTDGEIDDALNFDGTDDYMLLPSVVSLTGPFTVSMWIRSPLTLSGNQIIFAGAAGRFGLTSPAPGDVRYRLAIGGSFVNYVQSQLTANNWHHVVVRRDTSDIVEIITDANLGSKISAGARAGTFDFNYIAQNSGGGAFFAGGLDDIRIYNRWLDDDEVAATYDQEANYVFTDPLPEGGSGIPVMCAQTNIYEDSGLGKSGTWDVEPDDPTTEATTTFMFPIEDENPNGPCAVVSVGKTDTGTTTIVSRGYNSCDPNDARRVERAIRAKY